MAGQFGAKAARPAETRQIFQVIGQGLVTGPSEHQINTTLQNRHLFKYPQPCISSQVANIFLKGMSKFAVNTAT